MKKDQMLVRMVLWGNKKAVERFERERGFREGMLLPSVPKDKMELYALLVDTDGDVESTIVGVTMDAADISAKYYIATMVYMQHGEDHWAATYMDGKRAFPDVDGHDIVDYTDNILEAVTERMDAAVEQALAIR